MLDVGTHAVIIGSYNIPEYIGRVVKLEVYIHNGELVPGSNQRFVSNRGNPGVWLCAFTDGSGRAACVPKHLMPIDPPRQKPGEVHIFAPTKSQWETFKP